MIVNRQFFVFALVGFMGTLAHFVTLILLVEQVEIAAVPSSSAGYLVGFLVNYSLNYKITFKCNLDHTLTLIKYFSVTVLGFILNMLLMHLICNKLGVAYVVGQLVVTATVFFLNYFLSSAWAFKGGLDGEA